MKIHKSALKRHRQSVKRNEYNTHYRSMLATYIKKLRKLMDAKQVTEAKEFLKSVLSLVGKVASKGIIHKNKASRMSSRLTKRVNLTPAA